MSITRKIIIGSAGLVGVVLLAWLGSVASNEYQSYQWQKRTDALQEAMIGPYRTDTYGGKTPEETWAMFLDALKKKDVELASKYIELGKREETKKYILSKLDSRDYDHWFDELKNLKKDSSQSSTSRSYYYFNYYNSKYKMNLSSSVVFFFNPYTKVWKILGF